MVDQSSDEILSRLRGISSDEKSGIGKLKCRIDDQAQYQLDELKQQQMNNENQNEQIQNQIQNNEEKLKEKDKFIEEIETFFLIFSTFGRFAIE
ncbi:hypothetical protein I4U23_010737 [Adineta vaga]|nr:hypothetical protein I4U23_010737 [Adineta vaga]